MGHAIPGRPTMHEGEARLAYEAYCGTLSTTTLDNRTPKNNIWARSLIRQSLLGERSHAATNLYLTDRVRYSLMGS